MKTKMKAVVMNDYGSIEHIEVKDISVPTPNENEVLIKIHSSSFNPADYALLMGKFGKILPSDKPHILGLDVAGVVEQTFNANEDFKVGDRVYAYLNITKNGSYAEYMVVNKDDLTLMPKNLSFNEAAATPLAALTAIQGLYEIGELKDKETILIEGASGAVGLFAIQMALLKTAKIYGTCSKDSAHLIEKYPLAKIINYKTEDITKEITEKVDLILNLAPMDQKKYQKLISILTDQGRLISAMGMAEPTEEEKHRYTLEAYTTKRSASRLKEITTLVENKEISPVVTSIWTLDKVKELYKTYEKHELYGKAVIEILK